jgi:acetyltransferase
MDVDYHGRMAFVAAVQRDGVEEFVGIARYGQTDEAGTIELGVTVTDAWQRRGVARLLIDRLLRYAAWRGFERVCGIVLPENSAMLALARRLGFDVSHSPQDGLMHISKALKIGYNSTVADVK